MLFLSVDGAVKVQVGASKERNNPYYYYYYGVPSKVRGKKN
jgi:hypothetical protein